MSHLPQFLDNKTCPVCGNQLTLFMQILKGTLLKGALWKQEGAIFKNQPIGRNNSSIFKDDDYFWINNGLSFSSDRLHHDAKTWNMFFFYVCNDATLKKTSIHYDINTDKICYYRSSALMELQEDQLVATQNFVIRDEMLIFKKDQPDHSRKVYILNSDYENNITTLQYYSLSKEQIEKFLFSGNEKLFTKVLPLIDRPNLEMSARPALLDRFNLWIAMS